MYQTHLNSTERIHPLLDIDSVPKQFVEYDALRRGMKKLGITQHTNLENIKEKRQAYSVEAAERRLWCLRVWKAEFALA